MGHNNSFNAAQVQAQLDDLSISENPKTASYPDSDRDSDSYHILTTSLPARSFPHFPELPSELQIQIWQQAILACPHAHDLGTISFLFTTPRWIGTRSPSMLIGPYTGRIVYGHSFVYKERQDLYSLMRTCRLSRQMVVEWWIEKVVQSPRGYNREKRETKERVVDVLGELFRQMKGSNDYSASWVS